MYTSRKVDLSQRKNTDVGNIYIYIFSFQLEERESHTEKKNNKNIIKKTLRIATETAYTQSHGENFPVTLNKWQLRFEFKNCESVWNSSYFQRQQTSSQPKKGCRAFSFWLQSNDDDFFPFLFIWLSMSCAATKIPFNSMLRLSLMNKKLSFTMASPPSIK